jgi:PucR family transcriptional regulator, purine catabolism regulatory protein
VLGLDLGQAQARAELWIALQYVDVAAPEARVQDRAAQADPAQSPQDR